MLACLRTITEAPPGAGHTTAVRVACRLLGLAKAGLLDPLEVGARVKAALLVREDGRGREDEATSVLDWAWSHAEPWRLPA
jgi:hypothetical protein